MSTTPPAAPVPEVDVATFRVNFPAFANTTTFPDAMLQFQLNFAALSLNPTRWGRLLAMGQQLVAAHFASLEAQQAYTAAHGGIPGAPRGIQTSKSVGPASVSYDVSLTQEEGAGSWNATIYGQRYYRLTRIVGAGPIQLGTPGCSPTASGAWPGPGFSVGGPGSPIY